MWKFLRIKIVYKLFIVYIFNDDHKLSLNTLKEKSLSILVNIINILLIIVLKFFIHKIQKNIAYCVYVISIWR